MRAQIRLKLESGKQRKKNEPWVFVKKNAQDRIWTNELTYSRAKILFGGTSFGLFESGIETLTRTET